MNPNLQNNSSNNFSGGDIYAGGNVDYRADNSRHTKITIGSIAVVVVLLLVGFSIYKTVGGGGSSLEKQVVGTWHAIQEDGVGHYSDEGDYTFNSDHTMSFTDSSGTYGATWKIDSSKNFILEGEGGKVTFLWTDSSEGLALKSGVWHLSGDVMYFDGERLDRQ